MQILFVIDNLSTGGAQRQMVNLALGLKKKGHSIHFFCYSPGDFFAEQLSAERILVMKVLKDSRFSLKTFYVLRDIIKNGKYDVVLSFLQTPNFYTIISSQFIMKRPRVVVSERSNDIHIEFFQRLIRQSYKLADYIVVNSYSQQENFRGKYGWATNKIATIYNGIDLNKFKFAPMIVLNDPIKILVVASVRPLKNGLCLIEALKILRNENKYYPSIDWVGEKILSGEPLKYLEKMEKAIFEYELSDQWHWLGQRNDVVNLIHDHGVLILPSYQEGLPNVVCEAMACGRPVIVSDILDHPRLVQNGVSGFLFDWRDPASLAKTIYKFYQLSNEERNGMGIVGRQFAEQNLSNSFMVDNYETLFKTLLD